MGLRKSDLGLPREIWDTVFSYLDKEDLQELALVGRQLRSNALPHLYSHVIFSEWAGRGLRLANAIESGSISRSSIVFIRSATVSFTSLSEISSTIHGLGAISENLSGIERLEIHSHRTEEGIWALNYLGSRFADVSLHLVATTLERVAALREIEHDLFPRIRTLRIPSVFRSIACALQNLDQLEVDMMIHDTEDVFVNPPERLSASYVDWTFMGCPPCRDVELRLAPGFVWVQKKVQDVPFLQKAPVSMKHIAINSSALVDLKLVGNEEVSKASVHLTFNTPSLRTLILRNVSPALTETALSASQLCSLEFLAFDPASVVALRAAFQAELDSLALALVVVVPKSFESLENDLATERNTLIAWIHMLASKHPTDVRDFTGWISRDLYFTDGLWCSITHGFYNKFVPRIESLTTRIGM